MVFGFDSATANPRRKCTRSRGGAIVMAAPRAPPGLDTKPNEIGRATQRNSSKISAV